jgi:chromosome segregation ATPase
MRSAGQIGREEISLLIDEMGRATSGASVALMDTFAGKWSNLQDEIEKALNAIAKGGLLDAVTDSVGLLVEKLAQLSETGQLEAAGKRIGEVFETISASIAKAVDLTTDAIDLTTKAASVFSNLSTTWDDLWILPGREGSLAEYIEEQKRAIGELGSGQVEYQATMRAWTTLLQEQGISASSLVERYDTLDDALKHVKEHMGEMGATSALLVDAMAAVGERSQLKQAWVAELIRAGVEVERLVARYGSLDEALEWVEAHWEGMGPVGQAYQDALVEVANATEDATEGLVDMSAAAEDGAKSYSELIEELDRLGKTAEEAIERAQEKQAAFAAEQDAYLAETEEYFGKSSEAALELLSVWDEILTLDGLGYIPPPPQPDRVRALMRPVADEVRGMMEEVRAAADTLETLVADSDWPLPKYREMLFIK